ncbi:hypothetical protein ACQP1O_17795 [Nocardia sp. CA-151230]|uniref:hypothetical protein n=1 Tax=Nocardia sp. CA-151230 TaxID=3239982 RepID=UPI003D8EF635
MDSLPETEIVLVGSALILTEVDEDDAPVRNAEGQIARQFRYTIVPDDEADPAAERYSEHLPASQVLLGQLVNNIVETTSRSACECRASVNG